MNCNNIIATPEFSKALKRLAKHYKSIKNDFSQLLEQLKENPTMGINLGRGLRKIRMTITSKGKGKAEEPESSLWSLYTKSIAQKLCCWQSTISPSAKT